MTRTYSASVDSYLSEPRHDLRLIAEIAFTNTTMRLWTGVGTLMVGTTHYDGIGLFGGVDRIAETAEIGAPPIKLYLSAVNSSTLSEAVNETLYGKNVTLRRCWLDQGTVVNTAERWYYGQIGAVDLVRGDSERGNYVECTLQTKLDTLAKPQYYNKEDLSLTYSGDTFFNYLDKIQNFTSLWGQKPTRFSDYRPIQTVQRGRYAVPRRV